MRALYCHDNFYSVDCEENVCSKGQFSYEYWSTFLESFEELTIVGRKCALHPGENYSNYNKSSGPGVSFELMPDMNSVAGIIKYRGRISKCLENLVADTDAIIIRACSDIGWLAYLHARRQGKPVAMEMAACAWDSTWYHGRLLGKFYAPVRFMHDRLITANAGSVIYVSRHFLQQRYPARGLTAVASNVRIETPDREILARRLERIKNSPEKGPVVIGLIGTITHKLKGIHTALDAMRLLNEAGNNSGFIFCVLGPGDPSVYKSHAHKNGLRDKVFFDGVIRSGEEVLQWLDNIDIYIQPSFQEGVPRALIEAMSRGCPAIGSTSGGIPELLPGEWLHRPGDVKNLAVLLDKMMKNVELREKAARENFARSFEYTSDKLLPIRRKFWRNFAAQVRHNCLGAPDDRTCVQMSGKSRMIGNAG